MKAIIVVALALSLGGCATGQKLTPEQVQGMINAAAAAGCSGSMSIALGGATAAGVSPGSAHGEFSLNGSCDPSKAPKPSAQ